MGGNAVEGVVRASPEHYAKLKNQVHLALSQHFTKVATPIEFPNKMSYGDVDIIYAPYGKNITDIIFIEFGADSAGRSVANGKTVSFPLENVQIDLIGETVENFDIAVSYYSYGDLGRAIGAIAHWYGLRWSKHGLMCPINCRDPSRPRVAYPWNFRDCEHISTIDWESIVTLSEDMDEVLNYFGFDALEYKSGFLDELQIWKWLTSTPYFDIDIFARSISQLKDKAACEKANFRPTYCRFLHWLSVNVSDVHYSGQLPNPVEYFNKSLTVNKMVESQLRAELRKSKFSGYLLVEAGVEKRYVGQVLQWLKAYFLQTMMPHESTTCLGMDAWIDCTDAYSIREWVVESVKVWRDSKLEDERTIAPLATTRMLSASTAGGMGSCKGGGAGPVSLNKEVI